MPHDITLQAGIVYLSIKSQWMIYDCQTMGGLTVYCVDAFTTYYIAGIYDSKITVDET